MPTEHIYFASDFHLGIEARVESKEREKRLVRWLHHIQENAHKIFLVGDLFDFWFEYKRVVPKGYIHLLGTLAELVDSGIQIEIFTGNHDMWMFDYFPKELGITVHKNPIKREFAGKQFYIGHGDGLGPGDYGYKIIKKVFRSSISQWFFARLHPNFGIWLANFWSAKSRNQQTNYNDFLGEENEWLYSFCNDYLQHEKVDFFVFGHRHLPIDILLHNNESRYINLGDWLHHFSYAHFDGSHLQIRFFENDKGVVYPTDQR